MPTIFLSSKQMSEILPLFMRSFGRSEGNSATIAHNCLAGQDPCLATGSSLCSVVVMSPAIGRSANGPASSIRSSRGTPRHGDHERPASVQRVVILTIRPNVNKRPATIRCQPKTTHLAERLGRGTREQNAKARDDQESDSHDGHGLQHQAVDRPHLPGLAGFEVIITGRVWVIGGTDIVDLGCNAVCALGRDRLRGRRHR